MQVTTRYDVAIGMGFTSSFSSKGNEMARFTVGAVVALAVTLLVGCDSKHEAAAKDMISGMNEFADALAGIKSNTDFVDAKPKLEKISAKMKDLVNTAKDLPKLSAEEEKKMEEKFKGEMEKVMTRVQSEMERLSKIGVSPMELGRLMSGGAGM